MPRLQLDLPAGFSFAIELEIYLSHLNTAAHVDNARFLGLVAEARFRYFKALGFSEDDVDGLTTTVTDVLWIYRSEAFHGDVLRIELAARDYNRYGFDLVYQMTRVADGREIGRGKHGMVFLDPATRKVAPVPPAFRDKAGDASATP